MSKFQQSDNRSDKTTDVWLTPPDLVRSLGEFMLDPCAPPDAPWYHAPIYYTEAIDGLKMPWFGRVWCNPPYGRAARTWLERCADHGNAMALIFARVETNMFIDFVWKRADAVMFLNKRIAFANERGEFQDKSGAPSCLIAYGEENHRALYNCSMGGTIVDIKRGTVTR